jgi:hypothetical protein
MVATMTLQWSWESAEVHVGGRRKKKEHHLGEGRDATHEVTNSWTGSIGCSQSPGSLRWGHRQACCVVRTTASMN